MMNYKEHKDFRSSLRTLYQTGGSFQKSAEQVQAFIGRISTEEQDPFIGMNLTHKGESRIKKCKKYDLNGFSRLITIQDNGIILLCFVGSHDDCDKWLNRNKGMTLIANEHNQLNAIQMSPLEDNFETRLTGISALTKGKLYEGLPEDYFERLINGISRKLVRKLEDLESIHDENHIYTIVGEINNLEQSTTVYDVFVLLLQDKRQQAIDRLKLFLGETQIAENLTAEAIAALADSETIKTLKADDPRFKQVFEHFVKSASYMDWMLFLHPDQESIVNRDLKGASKLVGVSGSGKTCIVVKRAIRLAEKYVNEKILILTLNRPLARLINDMVDAACITEVREQIEVIPFFKLCQNLLKEYEPENSKLYDDVTWKSKEHIDEVWREFYRCEVNNNDAQALLPIHDSLIARSVGAEQYIREEFDWIRSAFPPNERNNYFKAERAGRNYPLEKNFRERLIQGLEAWERKMLAVGVTDYLGIATAMYKHLNRIKPIYRCILIDESQDFGTIEYKIIQSLAKTGEDNLFFCGDAAQQVSAKHRSFREAGITIAPSNSLKIQKNYRNSRENLLAAFDVLYKNLSEEMLDSPDFEILDPEYANFSAAPPLILQAINLENEIASAIAYLKNEVKENLDKKSCLSICGYSLYQIQEFGKKLAIPVLDGSITIESGNLYLSDLEHTKGFEFDTMVIINCNDGVIPDIRKPEKERFRDISRFYVAMTRAKNQLIVSYSAKQSSLLANAETNFLSDDWSFHVLPESVVLHGIPPTLDSIRHEYDSKSEKHLLDMSGSEFLYTKYALGLDSLLIEKLRNVISGKSVIRDRVPFEWTTIRKAIEDTKNNPRSRQAFGSEGIRQFREFVEKINL